MSRFVEVTQTVVQYSPKTVSRTIKLRLHSVGLAYPYGGLSNGHIDALALRARSVAGLRAIVLCGNEAVIPNIVAPSVDFQTPQT